MLESILTEKKEPTGNILIFGDPSCGKKGWIETLNKTYGMSRGEERILADLERVYIMDFKYI